MSAKVLRSIYLAGCLGFLVHPAIAWPVQKYQPNIDPLARKIKIAADKTLAETTVEAFVHRLGLAGVPGGVATVSGCESEPAVQSFADTDSRLGEELDKLLQIDSGYRYAVNAGAVNLLPVANVPPLLETKIATFDVENEGVNEAFGNLTHGPDVVKKMASLGISWPKGLQIMISPGAAPPLPGRKWSEPKKVTLHLRKIRLIDALDALVNANGGGVWIYRERLCHGADEITFDLDYK